MWHDVLALNRLTRFLVMAVLVFAGYTGVRWAANQPVFAIRAITVTSRTVGRWITCRRRRWRSSVCRV